MKLAIAGLTALLLFSVTRDVTSDERERVPTMTINDLMVTLITPATNILWGIEDPQTDEDWQVFTDAANIVVDAGETIKIGGTGPNDDTWANDPEWDAFADRIIEAGNAAREAASNRSVDDMYSAGEILYSPCEECHIRFHPGMQ